MKVAENKVLILKEDYALLSACVKNTKVVALPEPLHTRSLSEELLRAEIVEKERFPADVIRLNATVIIKDLSNGNEITLRIVLPEFADIKHKKISVLAPMGTALIGLQKGQRFTWQVPAGIKNFLILDVKAWGNIDPLLQCAGHTRKRPVETFPEKSLNPANTGR